MKRTYFLSFLTGLILNLVVIFVPTIINRGLFSLSGGWSFAVVDVLGVIILIAVLRRVFSVKEKRRVAIAVLFYVIGLLSTFLLLWLVIMKALSNWTFF